MIDYVCFRDKASPIDRIEKEDRKELFNDSKVISRLSYNKKEILIIFLSEC